mmetsp:Transcript_15904/g.31913  ORF Transcript_15904/g.31913 Transcript_15904/m.31913 type:complete len:81 (+) Transcript_15904:1852-2094(+)
MQRKSILVLNEPGSERPATLRRPPGLGPGIVTQSEVDLGGDRTTQIQGAVFCFCFVLFFVFELGRFKLGLGCSIKFDGDM